MFYNWYLILSKFPYNSEKCKSKFICSGKNSTYKIRKVEDFASNFDKIGLTWSVFRSVREALDFDPDLTEDNPLFKKILQPDAGEFLVPKHPANFSKVENSDPTAAPILGEHTEEILGDVLNLSDIEVSNLFDNGVVASPSFHKNK